MCMRDRRYRWVLVLTACVLIGMLIVSALSRPDLPETVPVTQAAKEDVYNTVSVKGTVRAKRESQEFVYAPARVEACYVSLGETVEAGQPLIQVYYPEVSEEVQHRFFRGDGQCITRAGCTERNHRARVDGWHGRSAA